MGNYGLKQTQGKHWQLLVFFFRIKDKLFEYQFRSFLLLQIFKKSCFAASPWHELHKRIVGQK